MKTERSSNIAARIVFKLTRILVHNWEERYPFIAGLLIAHDRLSISALKARIQAGFRVPIVLVFDSSFAISSVLKCQVDQK